MRNNGIVLNGNLLGLWHKQSTPWRICPKMAISIRSLKEKTNAYKRKNRTFRSPVFLFDMFGLQLRACRNKGFASRMHWEVFLLVVFVDGM